MYDLIDRQAAIDAVTAWLHKAFNPLNRSKYNEGEIDAYKTVLSELKKMPSAQPEIIRCKECKHSEHWYRDRRRCFLWAENGVSVFDDGFCNYAERRTDD